MHKLDHSLVQKVSPSFSLPPLPLTPPTHHHQSTPGPSSVLVIVGVGFSFHSPSLILFFTCPTLAASHLFYMCLIVHMPLIYLCIRVDKKITKYYLYGLLWCTLMVLGCRVPLDSFISHRASVFRFVLITALMPLTMDLTMDLVFHVALRDLRSDSCFSITTFSSRTLSLLVLVCLTLKCFHLISNSWKFSFSIYSNIFFPFPFFLSFQDT